MGMHTRQWAIQRANEATGRGGWIIRAEVFLDQQTGQFNWRNAIGGTYDADGNVKFAPLRTRVKKIIGVSKDGEFTPIERLASK